MENASEPKISLGFCEKVNNWELHRAYFRSKTGGFPAWLNPDKTPKVTCPFCQQPMILLSQVYAEKDSLDHAYHRTVYVFTCRHGECHKVSVESEDPAIPLPYTVLRCQLPRINDYYEPDQSENYEQDKHVMVRADQKLVKDFCFNCGQEASYRCNSTAYCGKLCERNHRKTGHNTNCNNSKKNSKGPNFIYPTQKSSWCFEEYEIVDESEPSDDEEERDIQGENERLLKEIDENGNDFSDTELDAVASSSKLKVDKVFEKFKKRINREPAQVLRYIQDEMRKCWTGALHISDSGKQQAKDIEIPFCELCKSDRILEFQIMPQILCHLNADKGVDFGVLNVFTCKANCKIDENGYAQEFLTREMVAPDSIVPNDPNYDDDDWDSEDEDSN